MKSKQLIYTNTSKAGITFNLYATNGNRDYSHYIDILGEPLITNDNLFLITIVDKNGVTSVEYPFYTNDISECAYQVIKNKNIPSAKQKEANKIIKRIIDALGDLELNV